MTSPHWYRFDWDDENKKNGNIQHLRDHDIEPQEAEECVFTIMSSRSTIGFDDVYVLDGKTDRGRRLRLIFQDKGRGLARVFSGWELNPTKKRKK